MNNQQQQPPMSSGVVPATPGAFDFYSAARGGGRWVASGSAAGGRGSGAFFRPVSEEPESAAAVRDSYWSDGDGGGGGGEDYEVYEDDEDDKSSDEGRRRHHQRMLRDPPLPTRIPKEDRLRRSSSIAPAVGCCCSSPSAARRSCGGTCSRCCDSFLTRFSVTGAVGLVCCVVGAVMFAVCSHSAANLTLQLMQEAFNMTYYWLETCQIILTSIGCLMIALSVTVTVGAFVLGLAVPPEDNAKLKPAGKTPPLVFISMLLPALPVWLGLFATSLFVGVLSLMLDGVCNTDEVAPLWQTDPPPSNTNCSFVVEAEVAECVDCIDLYPFNFLFPEDARKEDMWLCGREIWLVCTEAGVPRLRDLWILGTVGCMLVVLGVTVHLMDLVHSRTSLGVERNRREVEEMRYINKRVSKALSVSNEENAELVKLRRARQLERMKAQSRLQYE